MPILLGERNFHRFFRHVPKERSVKRLLIGASLVTWMSGVAFANTPIPRAHATAKPLVVPNVRVLTYKVAPADEYFGRLKMSILGIRNTIKDQGLKVDADPTRGDAIVSTCSLTEDALHDWEKKYPRDSWLPGSILTLERLYAKIDSDVARAKAKATMLWLVRDYPKSPQGKVGKVELASNKVGVKPETSTTASVTPQVGDAAVPPSPSPSP